MTDAGHDTVAAMAGAVAGAHQGSARLPERLLRDLEHYDRLHGLADGLFDVSRRFRGAP